MAHCFSPTLVFGLLNLLMALLSMVFSDRHKLSMHNDQSPGQCSNQLGINLLPVLDAIYNDNADRVASHLCSSQNQKVLPSA
ncbi:hypothetical protein BCR37DRAFT_166578 [Protomyces lactucae-debilis]|uniref:Uncharacterized protein n=1 Tax=Protomyces lactucae-debilis TaxID=2754530 RepID=A0A1Y2EWT5_PROLT|nr:uncharacterized protein BCR37DRAFT_166578 [Protomyces lactucae-debilis]ORY76018.1 hypothetical protein BCR37DRAFT_166578 [Protomyces lactucae-debilis]